MHLDKILSKIILQMLEINTNLLYSVLLRIKWKFKLTVYFKHELLGQL